MVLNLQAEYEAGAEWENWLKESGRRAESLQSRYDAVELSEEDERFLRGVKREVHILCLSEAWCGDCIRQVPVCARMCAENKNLKLRIIGRDDHLEVMERYLFNGVAVVPVFVFFNEQFVEVGSWKARPARCREIIARGKAAGRLAEAKAEASRLMDECKDRMTIDELKHLIDMGMEAPES